MKTGRVRQRAAAVVLFGAMSTVHAADWYIDMNGTDAGFGTAANVTVDFTSSVWNSDPTGGAAGVFTNSLADGDIIHAGSEGSSIQFSFVNYTNTTIGGIHSFAAASGATIGRIQKNNADGLGWQALRWAPGAQWNTEVATPWHWNLGSVGDFEKVGSMWLTLADGGLKIDGTCTITEGNIVLRSARSSTVNANSDFVLNGGQLEITSGGTALTVGRVDLGAAAGSGIVRGGGDLSALTLTTQGSDLQNNSATNRISFNNSLSLAFGSGATNVLEITKESGITYADKLGVSGTINCSGTLIVTQLASSAVLAEGDSFDLLDGTFSGSFDTVVLPPLSDGLVWSTINLPVNGSIQVVAPAAGPPADPGGLTMVTSGVYTATLDWDDNTDLDLAGYRVYRSDTAGTADLVQIAELGPVSEYVDTSVHPNDNTHYYAVTAFDTADEESGYSDPVEAYFPFTLGNGDFESPDGYGTLDASGHWVQNGTYQEIAEATWAAAEGDQGVRLKGWNLSVTNSFYQDKEAVPGSMYTLDGAFKIGARYRVNGGTLDMSLVWLDGSNDEISRTTLDVMSAISTDGSFVYTNVSATAPGNAVTVRSEIYWTTTTNANDATVSGDKSTMLDDFSLVKAGEGDLYGAWVLTYGLSGSPEADLDYDFDNDGMDNLFEYGVGSDPTTNDASVFLPAGSVGPAGDWYYFTHNERTDDASLSFEVQRNDSLSVGSWTNSGVVFVGESPSDGGFKSVTNRTDVESIEFLRLEIERN